MELQSSLQAHSSVEDEPSEYILDYQQGLVHQAEQMANSTKSTKYVLLISTWRSGSSTFAKAIAKHPDVFLHYEPLNGQRVKDLHSDKVDQDVFEVTERFLQCDYQSFPEGHLKWLYTTRPYLTQNPKTPTECNKKVIKDSNPCLEPNYIKSACERYPIQIVKFVRITLKQVAKFLETRLDQTHVIWLSRDPRAVWHSRINNKAVSPWCMTGLCGNLTRLCETYKINMDIATELKEKYPERFYTTNFERVQRDPLAEFNNVLRFLGLEEDQRDVISFIKSMQSKTQFNTRRTWLKFLQNSERAKVEDECRIPMKELGYAISNAPLA